MGVTIGSTGVGSVTLGGMPLAAIHVGTTKVWPSTASMELNLTVMGANGYRGYVTIRGLWREQLPDLSTITAIEIVEGSGAGTRFEITGASTENYNTLTFNGPTLPGNVNWELVTRLRIYYTP